jgi:hypothetical protein
MIDYHISQKLTFAEDPNPFTIQAVSISGRWVAATRAWCQWDIDQARLCGDVELFDQDLMGGWLEVGDCVYSVLDVVTELRGADNAIGALGYETREECERAVALFDAGEFEFSQRCRPIPLRIAAAVTR